VISLIECQLMDRNTPLTLEEVRSNISNTDKLMVLSNNCQNTSLRHFIMGIPGISKNEEGYLTLQDKNAIKQLGHIRMLADIDIIDVLSTGLKMWHDTSKKIDAIKASL